MNSAPSSPRRTPTSSVRVGLLATLLFLAGLVATALPATAGQGAPPTTDLTGYVDEAAQTPPTGFSQGCMPAGGSAIPDPEVPDGDFVFVGGGWGHGAGMSQYGAQGAGRLGCSAEQILTTYFTGTQLATVPMPAEVVIGLATDVRSLTVTAQAQPIPYELCHNQTGACSPVPVQQPGGVTWRIEVLGDASYRILDTGGGIVWEGGDFEHDLRAVLSPNGEVDRRALVSTTGHTYRWGVLQIDSVQTAAAAAYVTLEIPDMDLYLRGLAEVPASWPAATLQAQAVSGRSYALQRTNALGIRDSCRCNLLATPADQNYEGWDYESADAGIGGNWRSAVEATSGQVLLHDGEIAETFYSSSHGGHSESSRFVFGGELPYVQPVDDSRWDLASSNPLRRWTVAVSADQLGAVAGVGRATGMTFLDPRGAAGRVGNPSRGWGGVRVEGTGGSAVLSGDQIRLGLGLRSTLYRLAGEETPVPPPPVVEPAPPEARDVLQRAAAGDRIATAVAVAQAGWSAAPDVVLAASDRFPDALAGVRLAASLEAPLLLTPPGGLSESVAAELQRLGTMTVWVLGGSSAVAGAVESDLADLGITTRRLAGGDRFATAAAIATAANSRAEEVTVALGADWPDAVSASSLAALLDGPPTLLVQRDAVPGTTVQAIRDLGATRATIVGGTAVVTDAVAGQLAELGLSVTRLAGGDRYATSAAVASEALDRRGLAAPLILASGTGFADALSAGALAARQNGILLLAPRASLADGVAAADFIDANAERLDGGTVVGGTGIISGAVEGQIEELLAAG